MNDMTRATFLSLIQAKKIRIPKIQRDYAEGRNSDHVREIRRAFLNALLRTVYSVDEETMHLDFVYGYDRADAFEPLDGQQRLTTLFLLHWLFSPPGNADLIHDSRSRFTYETRISAEEFCDEIVKHDAIILYQEAFNSGKTMQDLISQRDWFKWSWRKDPSVVSMLVVIDEALEIMRENGYVLSPSYYNRLSLITFNFLDLSECKQGDELYVKMNARGKQLSSFDILKSTLEEEIRLQCQDQLKRFGNNADAEEFVRLEQLWRRTVDREWIDYFWAKRHRRPDGTINVSEVENKYMRLLLRIISLQFARQDKCPELARLANSGDERELEKIISSYVAIAWKARTTNSGDCPFIDFKVLMDDMNALMGKQDTGGKSKWCDFSEELDAQYSWDADNQKSILELYLGDTFSYPVRLGFYGLLSFLRKFPFSGLLQMASKDMTDGPNRLEDLRTWGRFLRNCTIIENCNDRFDSCEKVITAMNLIDKWMDEYANSGVCMREFIANIGIASGFERARVSEETIKAKLQFDDKWRELIRDAETDGYLRGQIICLINWAKVDGRCEKNKFLEYHKKLSKITGLFLEESPESQSHLHLFYAAMLALGDYRFGKHNSLGIISPADRFYSWKRYLRDEIAGCCAPGIKRFIDYWLQKYPNIEDVTVYCKELINELQPRITDWRAILVSCPELFSRDYAAWGVVTERDGHYFLAKGKTENSRSYEILISYVYQKAPCDTRKFYDSIQLSNVANSIEYSSGEYEYRLQSTANGTYSLAINGFEQKNMSGKEVLTKLDLEY